MFKIIKIAFLLCAILAVASPALAQTPAATPAGAAATGAFHGIGELGGSLGVGLVVIGAAMGISRLASSALESMARQPEVAGSVQTGMIIAAALIEGFTFFAIFVCWQHTSFR